MIDFNINNRTFCLNFSNNSIRHFYPHQTSPVNAIKIQNSSVHFCVNGMDNWALMAATMRKLLKRKWKDLRKGKRRTAMGGYRFRLEENEKKEQTTASKKAWQSIETHWDWNTGIFP